MHPSLLLLVLALAAEPAPRQASAEEDRTRLLHGVEAIERLGVPGTIAVFGDEAFVVLTARGPVALAAAARYGEGRAFAIAHGAYLGAGLLGQEGSGAGRLYRDALAWAGGREGPLRIGLVRGGLARAMEELGHAAMPGLEDEAGPCDVAMVHEAEGSEERAAGIRAFVEAGGGVIAGACPWGFEQVGASRGLSLREGLLANRVLAPMGLAFARGYAEPTRGQGFGAAESRPARAHIGRVLALIEAGDPEAAAGLHLVETAIQCVPESGERFWSRVEAIVEGFDPVRAPRPTNPLRRADAAGRLYVSLWTHRWRELPVEEVPALPGADQFPGAVPEDAQRIAVELSLAPEPPGWRSTGLYLAPGELLEVEVEEGSGWRLRVGCHSDGLWGLGQWNRWPSATIEVPLAAGGNRIASPWGGAVYLVPGAGTLRARVEGAVEAPLFALGDPQSAERWSERRAAPGPWAELVGRHLAISLPSESIRNLDDPAPALEYWDSVVLAHCELGGTPPPARPERFVADAQISAGYMHSGYPIMTWLDVATPGDGRPAPVLDVETLRREGNWGYFHELGHNRQRGEWTFAGTGEVTCNLFTLYSMDRVVGIEPGEHPSLAGTWKARDDFLGRGAPFAEWQGRPFLALLTYVEIQTELGWEPFRRVFREYEALPATERPRSDLEKIDGWVRRLSLAAGRDLRPHHLRWGLPLGEALLADPELDELPVFEVER